MVTDRWAWSDRFMVWMSVSAWMAMFLRHFKFAATVIFVACCAGCCGSAQMVWSPDGSQAAYRCGMSTWLIDEKGTVLRQLGSSAGGFAWSADSKMLYFASIEKAQGASTPLQERWLPEWAPPTTVPATSPIARSTNVSTTLATTFPDRDTNAAVSLLHLGNVQTLFRLAGQVVCHMQISPDGLWLAAITIVNKATDSDTKRVENDLFVYSLRSNQLYLLSRFCGIGACFTGPARLAFVECNGTDAMGKSAGRLVEVTLDEGAAKLARTPLLDVRVPTTGWLESCDAGVIFTAEPIAYPARPVEPSAEHVYKLYHYNRADHGLTVLADDVGELFDKSPDGKHILYQSRTPPTPVVLAGSAPAATVPADKDVLCVMNSNGSDPHELRSLDHDEGMPMWPAWRGTDQIAFISQPDTGRTVYVDDEERTVYDVMLYHLTDGGELDPLRTLSGDWEPKLKPYCLPDKLNITRPRSRHT